MGFGLLIKYLLKLRKIRKSPIIFLITFVLDLKWEAVVWRCSVKKVFLERHLARVFSCEFCKISKSTFFHRTPLVAASVKWKFYHKILTAKYKSNWQKKCLIYTFEIKLGLISKIQMELKSLMRNRKTCCFLL